MFFYLLIIAGSSIPGHSISSSFDLPPDKLLHLAEYFLFGCIMMFWIIREYGNRSLQLHIGLLFILGATAAMLDELYQHLTPGRQPDALDWCLDVAGIGLTAILFYLLKRRTKEKH